MLQEVLEIIDWVALRTTTSGTKGSRCKGVHGARPGWENGKRTPVRTNSVGEAVHVHRERKGVSYLEEKKKNGKHNDPGKAL
jgi:hypothetical protein